MKISKEEDEEYDPRVKADVVAFSKAAMMLKKMWAHEKMHFALGNLLHDMDMAGYMRLF